MILLLKVCKVNRFIHKNLGWFFFCLGILTMKKKIGEDSVLLDYVDFQKIKINFFYKIIL